MCGCYIFIKLGDVFVEFDLDEVDFDEEFLVLCFNVVLM